MKASRSCWHTRFSAAPGLGVLVAVLGGGCFQGTHRAYEGPARPAGEVARVSFDPADRGPLGLRPQWWAVDGRRVWRELPETVEVLPGARVLEFRFPWSNGYRERFTVTLSAEAGTEYVLTFGEKQAAKSFGRQMLESAGEGLGQGLGAFALPLVLFQPRDRPAGHSAYVRIKSPSGAVLGAWEVEGK